MRRHIGIAQLLIGGMRGLVVRLGDGFKKIKVDTLAVETGAAAEFGTLVETVGSTPQDARTKMLVDETGTWIADYVRLRFRAVLPRQKRGL